MRMKYKWVVGVIVLISLTSCIYIFRDNSIDQLQEDEVAEVSSPVKIHMIDGETVIFRDGAGFTDEWVFGKGLRYSINLQHEDSVEYVSRDSIAAYEIFNSEINAGRSVGVSFITTLGVTAVTPFLLVAIFGSCPTIYSVADSGAVLQSEMFSNSIAPILEARDVSTLTTAPDENGILSLEVRNEALETHYINQLELMEVVHEKGERVVPDTRGVPYVLGEFKAPAKITNSTGTDVTSQLKNLDRISYEYEIPKTRNASDVQWDYLDISFSASETENGALFLKARNSLFSTVLLYDYLLAAQGVGSLDWIGEDLETVSEIVALGDFFHSYTGIMVEQDTGNGYVKIGRVNNVGPIGWRDISVPVKVSGGDSVKIRLKFLADSWRIDQIEFAEHSKPAEVTFYSINSLVDSDGSLFSDDMELVSNADDAYLVTYPAESFQISYQTKTVPEGKEASYLLAGQGYYTEWIREGWIKDVEGIQPVNYSEEMLTDAQQSWQNRKAEFEQQFFSTKVGKQ